MNVREEADLDRCDGHDGDRKEEAAAEEVERVGEGVSALPVRGAAHTGPLGNIPGAAK